jgi:TonB family protein
MMGIRFAAAALLLAAATPASAQTLFGWSGGWEISQKREFCTMRHEAAGITVTKAATNGRISFGVTSPGWSFDTPREYWVNLSESGVELANGWAAGGSVPGWPAGFSMDQMGDEELAGLFGARTVTVHFVNRDHVDVSFAMPPSAMALHDLDRCIADITAHESGSGAPAVTPPRLRVPQADLMTPEDYPPAAIRAQVSGTVTVRLLVTAIGYPAACTVIAPSGSEVLDKTTCGIYFRRARFEPARDAKGRATTGSYDLTKQWVVPPYPGAMEMQ